MSKKLDIDQSIEVLKREVEVQCNSLFLLINKIRINLVNNNHSSSKNEEKALVQCLLQQALIKIRSIQRLADGTKVINDKSILDISSMLSIERSLYELMFIVHNIFVMSDNEYEKQILINLWKIRGLNNRQNIECNSKEQQKQQEHDKQVIDKLKEDIFNITLKLNIEERAKNNLKKIVDNKDTIPQGFIFKKGENGIITNFEKISFTAAVNELFSNNKTKNGEIYKLLSAHTHPSYLGVLQFGQMYNNSKDKQYLKDILNDICLFSSFLINTFCKSISNIKSFFYLLPKENKDIINTYIIIAEEHK